MRTSQLQGEIILIHDTLCGWCFVARPEIQKLRGLTTGIPFRLLHLNLFREAKAIPINDGFLSMVKNTGWNAGPKKTGAKMGEPHLDFLKKKMGQIYASDMTALACAAVEQINPEVLPDYADALQEEVFVNGADYESESFLVNIATHFAIDSKAMTEAMQAKEIKTNVTKTATEANKWLSKVGGRGVPTLIWHHQDQIKVLDSYDAEASFRSITEVSLSN